MTVALGDWNHQASSQAHLWSVIFGGQAAYTFTDDLGQKKKYEGSFGGFGFGVGGGYCWGDSYWDDAGKLTSQDSDLLVTSAVSSLTITSMSVNGASAFRGQFFGLGINDVLLGIYGGRGKFKND